MDLTVGKSRLESMPGELLLMVMKVLMPDDALRHPETRYRAAYKKRTSNLNSLCFVSKTLEAAVRPVIFDKIVICRSIELILLLRTLIEEPGLGEYIKTLELSTKFVRNDPDHEFLDLGILRGLDPDLDLRLPEGPARMTSRQENDVRSTLYLMVLNRAPKVQKATVNPPTWAVRGLGNRQLAAFGIVTLVAHHGGAISQASQYPLPNTVTTLTIEGDRWYRGLAEGLPGQISGFWGLDPSNESNLKKMTWLFDDTTWFDSLPAQRWGPDGRRGQLTSLTALYLGGSACRFCDIAIICDSFPSLTKLAITSNHAKSFRTNYRTDRTDGLSPDGTRLCLTRSITKLQYLESLFLDLATGPESIRLLGDNGGLDLSSLSRLSVAILSFRLIVSNKKNTLTGSEYDPSLFLPQSLERLDIVIHGYRYEAGSNLVEFLEGLYTACKYGFPRLRLFECSYSSLFPGLGQTDNLRRVCVCARVPHEDYCTYGNGSALPSAFLPWLPTEKTQALHEKFGQRGIKLMRRSLRSYAMTATTNNVAP